jgi:hydroxymethylbilane synthase
MLVRIATRSSAQALAQTGWVADRLRAAHPGLDVDLVPTETTGDLDTTTPIWELGGKGVFAKEVQVAVLSGAADLAVHSAKDLPSTTPDGLVVAAVPTRRDPRDALVGARLDDIPIGGRVATGSIRRRAQLAALRPDLTFAGLRGNIGTRLERAAEHDAIVIAVAALEWLGGTDRIAEVLDPVRMLPQVAQGGLAVECRVDDATTAGLLAALEDPVARRCFDAERSFLRTLGGDCSLPAGAFATPLDDADAVSLEGLLAAVDGTTVLRHRVVDRPEVAGRAVAEHLLAAGGAALLGR